MTYTSHIWTEPVTTNTASAATKAAFQAREMSRMRLGELLSTTAPPTNMKAARGSACSSKVKPTAAGSWLILSTSQGRATRVKVSPMAERLLPENSQRKSRFLKTEARLGVLEFMAWPGLPINTPAHDAPARGP